MKKNKKLIIYSNLNSFLLGIFISLYIVFGFRCYKYLELIPIIYFVLTMLIAFIFKAWNKMFYLIGILIILGMTLYMFFGPPKIMKIMPSATITINETQIPSSIEEYSFWAILVMIVVEIMAVIMFLYSIRQKMFALPKYDKD